MRSPADDRAGGSVTTIALTQTGGTITQDGDVTALSAALNGGTYDHNAGTLQTTGGDFTVGGATYDGTGAGTGVTVSDDIR